MASFLAARERRFHLKRREQLNWVHLLKASDVVLLMAM
jgi:hypothetical protein